MNIRGRATALLPLMVAAACLLMSASGALAADDVWPPKLDGLWVTIGSVSLAIAAGRLLLDWGRYATSVIVFASAFALSCAGQQRTGRQYLAFVLAFVASALVAMRNGGEPAGKAYRAKPIDQLATVAMFIVGGAIAFGWLTGLPPAYHAVERYVLGRFNRFEATTGLTDRIDLESIDGILQSDRVVLRVYGPAPDALRGIVYDRYQSGRWRTARPNDLHTVRVPTAPDNSPGWITVRRVAGPTDRWFTSLGSTSFATGAGRVHIDPYGIARVLPPEEADVFWMHRIAGSSPAVAPPGPEDLGVPASIRDRLTALANQWVPERTHNANTISRLLQHLQSDYRYALRSHRRPGIDPVIDFLFDHRQGHCEYFASALALLGRAAGVPTRVVTGYRVAERSAVGGYYIVRDRNAHAWVEAYIDGVGWRTYDPTPGSEIPQNRPHNASFGSSLIDGLAAVTVAIVSFIAARTATEMAAGALLLALVYIVLRGVRARREAREEARRRGERSGEALDGFVRLDQALTAIGVQRQIGETLEHYADRVRAAPALQREADATAAAIRAYAAFRYGGEPAEEPVISASLATRADSIARLPRHTEDSSSAT